jgi:hypothetical protein
MAKEGETKKPRFELGAMCVTPGALEALGEAELLALQLLVRHASGDWGDLCEDDKRENEYALKDGARIFSAYQLSTGVKVWVITEADRSVTTLLLPSEY